MIHPNILAELPGIELQRNLTTPSRVTVRKDPNPTERAAAARVAAGLDAPPNKDATTRGVDDAPAAEGSDDADQGVEPDNNDDVESDADDADGDAWI